MMKAPSNEYETLRAGMEYKLALQAIRRIVRSGNGKELPYNIVKEIAQIIHSMEEDIEKRRSAYADDDGTAT